MNSKRYKRQIIISEVGTMGQHKLSTARVLCIGVGGLGSPVALYLAAGGVGTIGLIDHDIVDVSNLHRQILFSDSDQGRAKVIAAKERLVGLNPDVQVNSINEQFTHLNAEAILANYDLVIDGSDNFETKFLANDAAYKRGIPLIYGAVNRFEGETALFWGERGACYRCLHLAPPKSQVRNCAEAGVLGPVVGVIGSLQANLALQYLMTRDDPNHPLAPPIGQLTVLELSGNWSMRSLHVPKRIDCPTCSHAPAAVVLHFASITCPRSSTISASELRLMMQQDSNRILLIDVRESDEWAAGYLPGALHWPLTRLEQGDIPSRPEIKTHLVFYCRSGMRSARAATILNNAGISGVYSLDGGIEGWSKPY